MRVEGLGGLGGLASCPVTSDDNVPSPLLDGIASVPRLSASRRWEISSGDGACSSGGVRPDSGEVRLGGLGGLGCLAGNVPLRGRASTPEGSPLLYVAELRRLRISALRPFSTFAPPSLSC